MTNVSALPADQTAAQPGRARYRGIRRLSRTLGAFFTILLALAVLVPCALIAIAATTPAHMGFNASGGWLDFSGRPPPAGYVLVSQMPLVTRLAGVADLVLAAVPQLFILWHLRALFRLYARGSVFARENAHQIKRIGLWLILYLPLKFAANMIFQAAGGADHNWLQATGIYSLCLGVIVMLIAQVMELGHEIEKEHGEFV